MRYSPDPLVDVVREKSVATLVALTVAVVTTAPCASLTVPTMVPVTCWPCAAVKPHRASASSPMYRAPAPESWHFTALVKYCLHCVICSSIRKTACLSVCVQGNGSDAGHAELGKATDSYPAPASSVP